MVKTYLWLRHLKRKAEKSFLKQYLKGIEAFEAGKYYDADTLLEGVSNAYSLNEDIWILRGLANHKLKLYTRATNYFENALRLNPENTFVIFLCAQSTFYIEEYDTALELFFKVLDEDIEFILFGEVVIDRNVILHYIAAAYEKLGMKSRAVKYTKMALEDQPESAENWYRLGRLYEDSEDILMAIECYTNAKNIDQTKYFYFLSLGRLYYQLDETELALDNLEKAYELNPEEAITKEYLGALGVMK